MRQTEVLRKWKVLGMFYLTRNHTSHNYFTKVYNDNETLVIVKQGQVLAKFFRCSFRINGKFLFMKKLRKAIYIESYLFFFVHLY